MSATEYMKKLPTIKKNLVENVKTGVKNEKYYQHSTTE